MLNFKIASLAAVLLPLLGSCCWFWVGKKSWKAAAIGAVSMMALSFACIFYLFLNIDEPIKILFYDWIRLNSQVAVEFAFKLDPLSLTLAMIVTGVGSLIHLYATGYMKGDESFGRFFSYLNLFVFSMLVLTLSDSLVGLFLGWEGVGLCSYLLISFWFSEEANATAGKKAFIVNRVGDFGFLLGMFSIFKVCGTLSISEVLTMVQSGTLVAHQTFWLQLACFGFILGATGKSAQIPLFVWLPDAMAGPTPVSALIHAATMVTAGIYLTCRLQGLFAIFPGTLEVIAYVGAATAFLAATIAVFQNDIKKVLAYSTISQLGYMFLAVGLSAPVSAYFHLMTHAFFKALLFLGAGSVIHGLHHEQDMRHMGGLRKSMPITFWTMTIGVLAIAGVPPLSGFVSKDEILHSVAHSHRMLLMFFGFSTAFLTAFYMGRLWIMTFFGKFRGHHAAHESPWPMTSVLIVLAVLSFIGGFFNWPELWGGSGSLYHYLSGIVSQHEVGGESALVSSLELAGFSVLLGLSGLGLAWKMYSNYSESKDLSSSAFELFRKKYYMDEIYDTVFVKNLKRLGEFFWKSIDGAILDGGLNGIASFFNRISERLRGLQTGFTQQYALWVWLGFLILLCGAFAQR